MADFSIEIKPGSKEITVKLNRFNKRAIDRIHERMVEGGNRIRNLMITLMQNTPKSGRKYKRGKKWHIASSAGHAPAIDTGELFRSLRVKDYIDSVEVGAYNGAPYAKYLEEGTDKMKPRPFLKPAADVEVPVMKRKIIQDIERMKF